MMHGPAGTENDMPFIENLYISGAERRALENLQKGRSRTSVPKCLPRTYIEEMLERMLQVNGEQGLNKFRDSARIVSESLGMTAEFETLFSALHNEQFPFIDEPNVENAAFRNFAFFESYFSNYIEGTEFELEDAWQIVESGLPMPSRNADSHDVLGTFFFIICLLKWIGHTAHVPSSYMPNSRFNHTAMIGSGITTWRFSISISSFLTKARFTILTLADEPS